MHRGEEASKEVAKEAKEKGDTHEVTDGWYAAGTPAFSGTRAHEGSVLAALPK